jgi:hypothetical protein
LEETVKCRFGKGRTFGAGLKVCNPLWRGRRTWQSSAAKIRCQQAFFGLCY